MIGFLLGFILGSSSSSDEKSERFYGWILVAIFATMIGLTWHTLSIIYGPPPRVVKEPLVLPYPNRGLAETPPAPVSAPRAELVNRP